MRTLPRGLGLGHRAGGDQVVVRDDLGLDEAALEVGVDDAGGLRGGRALADRPGARLLRAGGQVGLQAEGVRSRPGRAGRGPARPGPIDCSSSRGLLVGQLDQLGLDLGVEEDRLGRRDERAQLGACSAVVGELVLVDVEDVDERLGGQQGQLAQRARSMPAAAPRRTASCRPRAPPAPRRRRRARPARSFLIRASFSSRGIAFSTVCRSARISSVLIVSMSSAGLTLPSTWTTSSSSKTRMTWQIASASRMLARNLLPSPSPSRGAADDAGDVDERHGRRAGSSREPKISASCAEPRVGHADDADVRLDRRERVVRREHVVLGQRVEQRATCRRWAGRRCRW